MSENERPPTPPNRVNYLYQDKKSIELTEIGRRLRHCHLASGVTWKEDCKEIAKEYFLKLNEIQPIPGLKLPEDD